jgi:hypothetical protein
MFARRFAGAIGLAVSLLFAAVAHAPANAGEINAANGVAISGYDPVAYFREGKPVKGAAQFAHRHKDATFHFASAANRDSFAASPEKYAPQYGGFCAYGTSRGYKAPIDPAAFTVVKGKLYLNYSVDVQQTWRKDIPGYVAKADGHWPTVRTQ